MKNHLSPTATASISTYRSAAGKTLLKVRVITPGDISFRDYEHDPDTPTEAVIAAALRSLGLGSAWVWGRLANSDSAQKNEATPEEFGP